MPKRTPLRTAGRGAAAIASYVFFLERGWGSIRMAPMMAMQMASVMAMKTPPTNSHKTIPNLFSIAEPSKS